MHPLDQKLAVLNIDPAVLQVDAARTQALDLGALQFNAGLQRFEHEVLVARLAVCGDGFGRRTFLGRCHEARLLSLTSYCPVIISHFAGFSRAIFEETVNVL